MAIIPDRSFINDIPHLYSPTEVARVLGRPLTTVYEWTGNKVFPPESVFRHRFQLLYTEGAISAGLEHIRSEVQHLRWW